MVFVRTFLQQICAFFCSRQLFFVHFLLRSLFFADRLASLFETSKSTWECTTNDRNVLAIHLGMYMALGLKDLAAVQGSSSVSNVTRS